MEELELNKVYCMDCLEGLKLMADNSVDSIVTDPPYGLSFMGKSWDTFDKSQFGKQGEEGINDLKNKKNFKILPRYNINGLYAFSLSWAKECLRVLKPGGFLLSFAGSRTYHKICSGIEDAGFEIRDQIMWIYGSGFPKSLNIGKAIDKLQGNERKKFVNKNGSATGSIVITGVGSLKKEFIDSKGCSKWEGWGTALKPAHEPIVVARKPLSEKTVALNVLKWGTGGINIDECRIKLNKDEDTKRVKCGHKTSYIGGELKKNYSIENQSDRDLGRFPANIILDVEAGLMLDEQVPETSKGYGKSTEGTMNGKGSLFKQGGVNPNRYDMGGLGASRFFYCAKSSKSERNKGCENLKDKNVDIQQPHNSKNLEERYNMKSKNNHPTVKPIKLMEYLVRLVTKPKGIVLDPFGGSGSTGVACVNQGFKFILFDREQEYCDIANARIKSVTIQTKLKC